MTSPLYPLTPLNLHIFPQFPKILHTPHFHCLSFSASPFSPHSLYKMRKRNIYGSGGDHTVLPSAFPKRKINVFFFFTLDDIGSFEFLVMWRHYLMLILYNVFVSEWQAWNISKELSKMFGLEAKEENKSTWNDSQNWGQSYAVKHMLAATPFLLCR